MHLFALFQVLNDIPKSNRFGSFKDMESFIISNCLVVIQDFNTFSDQLRETESTNVAILFIANCGYVDVSIIE